MANTYLLIRFSDGEYRYDTYPDLNEINAIPDKGEYLVYNIEVRRVTAQANLHLLNDEVRKRMEQESNNFYNL